MGTTGTDAGPEPGAGEESRWRVSLVHEFGSVALALAALVVSVIAMVKQSGAQEDQTELAIQQTRLAQQQTVMEQNRDEEEGRPKVSSWLLPDPKGELGGYLYVVNKDKSGVNSFHVKVNEQLVSLDFVPPCTRTVIPLGTDELQVFLEQDWYAYFRTGDTWWTFDETLNPIKGAEPTGNAAELSYSGAHLSAEDCEL
ncbi:hypothetical protein [Streptomyces sp. NPDC056527]|uniref:hypothetical protein n=1 Tax=Streptomyces sp. NPDC056527 TaxID=3345853 RepID=UPI0036AD3A99